MTGRKLVRFKEDLDEENKAIEENFRNYAKEFPPIWNHLNKEFEKELSKVDGTQRIEDVFRFIEHILDSN